MYKDFEGALAWLLYSVGLSFDDYKEISTWRMEPIATNLYPEQKQSLLRIMNKNGVQIVAIYLAHDNGGSMEYDETVSITR
jgi:hypothetical protein